MALSNEHVGPKTLAKIKIYILTRAELLCLLCYEIPCIYSIVEVGKFSRFFTPTLISPHFFDSHGPYFAKCIRPW